MGQTLYAIAALLAATSFSHTVMQRQVHMQRQGVAREVEEMAASVAIESVEVIRSRAFDHYEVECEEKGEDSADCKLNGDSGDINEFTYRKNSDHFAENNLCHWSGWWYGTWYQFWRDACDDIDDFHKMSPAVIKLPMGDEDTSVEFYVKVEVEYVAPMAAGSKEFVRKNHRTAYKQITVKVQDKWKDKIGVYVPEPVTISRVLAYDYEPVG